MRVPSERQWDRIHRLIEELDEVPLSLVSERLTGLEEAREDSEVIDYLRLNYKLPLDPALEPGDRLAGRYTIQSLLGRGGMGMVYRAIQDRTRREVALKVINPALISPDLGARFDEEIATLGQLEHRGIVRIFDADVHKDSRRETLFFAMEMVEGSTIDEHIRRRQCGVAEKLRLFAKVCEAVRCAHDRGFVHRDLKPQNILVRADNSPVILDFGLAATVGRLHVGAPKVVENVRIAGTPGYMSPEHFTTTSGVALGKGMDVYALGVILFELLAERRAFDITGDATYSQLRTAAEADLPELASQMDARVAGIIAKATRKDPEQRYYSAADLLKAVQRALRRFADNRDEEHRWHPKAGELIPETDWKLQRKLGEGGMGEVWLVEHNDLGTQRVAKFCRDDNKVRSLKREASLFKLLKQKIGQHPGFVRLHEVSLEDAPYYLLIDYVEGADLAAWALTRGGILNVPVEARIHIVAQAAEALQAAHDAGIIHRDIKPGNLLMSEDRIHESQAAPRVYIADFGIGQLAEGSTPPRLSRGADTQTATFENTAPQTGTRLYMAPELLSGEEATARSDIYALGVVLFQSLTGGFSRALPVDWRLEISDPLLQEDLERCFSGTPSRRFSSAAEFGESLRNLSLRRDEKTRREKEDRAREAQAYRRGQIRAASIAGVVVALIASLAIYSIWMAQRYRETSFQAMLEQVRTARNSETAGRFFRSFERIQLLAGHKADAVLRDELIASLPLTDLRFNSSGSLPPRAKGVVMNEGLDTTVITEASRVVRFEKSSENQWKRGASLPTGGLAKVRLSPDGRIVAICGPYGEAQKLCWSVEGSLPLERSQPFPVSAISFDTRSESIAVGSGARRIDSTSKLRSVDELSAISIYDTRNGRLRAELKPGMPESSIPHQILFLPDGTRLAVLSSNSLNITIWKWQNGLLSTRLFHPLPLLTMAADSTGQFLFTVTCDGEGRGRLYEWDLQPLVYGKEPAARELASYESPQISLAVSHGLDLIASAGSDGSLSVLSLRNGETVATKTEAQPITRVFFSKDDRTLCLESDGLPEFWDIKGHTEYKSVLLFPAGQERRFNGLDVRANDWIGLAGHGDGFAVLDCARGRLLGELPSPGLRTAAFGAHAIFAAGNDGALRWDISKSLEGDTQELSLEPAKEVDGLPGGLISWAVDENADYGIFSHPLRLFLLDLKTDHKLAELPVSELISPVAIGAGSRQFAGGSWQSNVVILWKLTPDGIVESRRLPAFGGRFSLSKDGLMLGCDRGDGIQLWRSRSNIWMDGGFVPIDRKQQRSPNLLFILDRTGTQLATLRDWATLDLYDVRSRTRIASFPCGRSLIEQMAFSADGRALVAISHNQRLHTWNLHAVGEWLIRAGLDSQVSINSKASAAPTIWTTLKFPSSPPQIKRTPYWSEFYRQTVAIEKDPSDPSGYNLRGEAGLKYFRLAQAAADFEKARDLMETRSEDYNSSWFLLYLAMCHVGDKSQNWQPELALKYAKKLLSHRPEDPVSHFLMGWVYFQTEAFEAALSEMNRVSELSESAAEGQRSHRLDAATRYCRALCLLNQNLPEAGRIEYALANLDWEKYPNPNPAFLNLKEAATARFERPASRD